jgi:hypothetical protein
MDGRDDVRPSLLEAVSRISLGNRYLAIFQFPKGAAAVPLAVEQDLIPVASSNDM